MRRRGIDVLLIAAIWAFAGLLNGSQPWVSFDTPDSEFHATMSVFTDEVTDRSPTPAYYWTRIGHIAPAHALTSLFGPVNGLEAYRLLLLAVMVIALYATLRRFTGRFNATVLALLATSNTVLLGYLGNPYPTASIMAGFFGIVALALVPRDRPYSAPLAAGAVLGWLAMVSPFGAIFGLVLYVAVALARDGWPLRPGFWARAAAAGAAGAVAAFGVLLLVGRVLFPGLDWLQTYLFWNSALNQADYIVDAMRWTYDPSMLVPGAVVLIGVGTWLLHRGEAFARVAVVLPLASTGFALLYLWRLPSNYLEIPHYQALQWPAALMALTIAAAGQLEAARVTWQRVLVAALAVGAAIAAGHWTGALGLGQARVLTLVAVAVFVAATAYARTRPGAASAWLAVIVATAVVIVSAQVLQNSRDTFGVSTDRLYANAFNTNPAELMLQSGIDAQTWLIDNTSPDDRVLPWVDAEWPPGEQSLLPLAAYQLWGANEAAHGPTVTESDIARWQSAKPTVIAMYGKSMQGVLDFWNGIPKEQRPTVPECIEVPWVAPDVATVCLTRLSW